MKLSMSMLARYLKDYKPDCAIINDEAAIRGLRFLPEEEEKLAPEYVYFGYARQFLSDPRYEDAYIVVHKKSQMLFENCDYEELLNALLSAFDYYTDWERRLLDAAAKEAPLQEIIDIGEEVLENPLMVGSVDGDIFAGSVEREKIGDPYWDETVQRKILHPSILYDPLYNADGEAVGDLTEEPQLIRNVYDKGDPVIMMYLKQDREPVACIGILQRNHELTEMNRQLAPVMGRYLIRALEFASPHGRIKSSESILKGFLEGRQPNEQAVRHLERKGLVGAWRFMIVCHITRGDQMQKHALIRTLKNIPQIYFPFIYKEDVVAVIKEEDIGELEGFLERKVKLSALCIGLSMAAVDWEMLPVSYRQSRFVLERSRKKPGIYRCEDFAFGYLREIFRAQELTLSLLHPALDILERYDRENHTQLRITLSVYLKKERNLLYAADTLHIHRNTLKYRLGRIRALTGLTLSDEEELAYLRLSDWLSVQN
ncbi:MAG: PucR family transcriptional regulator [Ruminococcus sp.]|jgi:hypothetical protein